MEYLVMAVVVLAGMATIASMVGSSDSDPKTGAPGAIEQLMSGTIDLMPDTWSQP